MNPINTASDYLTLNAEHKRQIVSNAIKIANAKQKALIDRYDMKKPRNCPFDFPHTDCADHKETFSWQWHQAHLATVEIVEYFEKPIVKFAEKILNYFIK